MARSGMDCLVSEAVINLDKGQKVVMGNFINIA